MKRNVLFIFSFIIFGLLSASFAQTDNFAGKTLEFDGNNDYVSIPHASIGNPSADFTFEVWVKLNSTPANNADIISKHKYEGGSSRSGFSLEYSPSNGIYAIMGTSSGWESVNGNTWNIDEWHHIAMTYNATTNILELFDNGISQGTTTVSNPAFNTNELYFGSSQHYSSNLLPGFIDEVRYWDIALDSAQIWEQMHLSLSGTEPGLVSYWQFNDGSGMSLTDIIGVNDGTLHNMHENDWFTSTIPFGSGISNTQTETNGIVNFVNTGVTMDFDSHNSAEITVSRIDTVPNLIPGNVDSVYQDQYWVVHRYGPGSCNADITFTIMENLTTEHENMPYKLKLFSRNSTSDTEWIFVCNASSVNAADDEVTFEDITNLEQFIIAEYVPLPPYMGFFENNMFFKFITHNFSSIDAGYRAIPTFTDIDGDNLKDMVVGREDGKLDYYEQDANDSTAFVLVESNFNGIDVGSIAAPVFTDLDGDGLLDLIIGKGSGYLDHYEQDSENSVSFSLVTTDFSNISVSMEALPALADFDGDGLLDLIVGSSSGTLKHYGQDSENSTSFSYISGNFSGIDIGNSSAPFLIDLEGDGLLDLIIGEEDGNVNHYIQDEKNSLSFSHITSHLEDADGFISSPAITDFNGSISMFVGFQDGKMDYYKQFDEISSVDFGNIPIGNYDIQSYYLRASNLVDDLHLNCPDDGFTISLDEYTGFVQNLDISPVNGKFYDYIYVRFEPLYEQDYSGSVMHTTTGSDAFQISLSGTSRLPDNYPGTALHFDGVDDYIDLGNSSSLKPVDNLSVECWVYVYDWPNMSGTRFISNTQGGGYNIGTNNSGLISGAVRLNGSYSVVYANPSGFVKGWHYIAMTCDGRFTKLFVDGDLKDENDSGTDYPIQYHTSNHTLLGAESGSGSTPDGFYFDGKLDIVRVWDVVLDENQIRENMHVKVSVAESGMLSNWQFNDETGNMILDISGNNNGTLHNMDETDWVWSTVPYGKGFSDSQTEATGLVDFLNTGVSMNFNTHNNAEITLSRIDTLSNIIPGNSDEVFDKQYWVLNRYGTGSFNADITFILSENLGSWHQSHPEALKLYWRNGNSEKNWQRIATSSLVDAVTNKITFQEISSPGQFVICTDSLDLMCLSEPFIFELQTNNLANANFDWYSNPSFTDIDSDGLLDLIVGNSYGNIYHYEQNSKNSTSFSEITDNFNGIDVGDYASPTFTDLDNDGILDLIIGEEDGNLNHYKQVSPYSASFTLVSGNLSSIDVGNKSNPEFVDIDGDDMLDLLIGTNNGKLHHYEQDSIDPTIFNLITDNFNSIDVGSAAVPAFGDINGDGLLDLIVGESGGSLFHYRQIGENSTTFNHVSSFFNEIDVNFNSAPVFTDLNGNSLTDLIVGEHSGTLSSYEQTEVDSIAFGVILAGTFKLKNYYLKAFNLTGNLNLVCPDEGFALSLSENSGFTSNLLITPLDGKVSDTIFVRFEPQSGQEYSGTIIHSSPGLTAIQFSLSGSGLAGPDGYPGSALYFDGDNDYVNCTTGPQVTGNAPRSVEVWAYARDFDNGGIFQAGETGADGEDFSFRTLSDDNEWRIQLWGADMDFVLENSKNEWHHYCLTYDGDTVRLYYDGAISGSLGVSLDTYSHDVWLGRWQNNYFKGKIDEVRFWDIALDSIQIRENMHLPLQGDEPGLISYWQFNEGAGDVLNDIVSGYDGILNNMNNNDWVSSPIPFGRGFSDSQIETPGQVDFDETGLTMFFSEENGAPLTVSRIDTVPNIHPVDPDTVFSKQYWVVNRFGNGSFNTDLQFTIEEDLNLEDENTPERIILFTRSSNSDENWSYLQHAASVDEENNSVIFEGIKGFSQFIIGRKLDAEIDVDPLNVDFGHTKVESSPIKTITISNQGIETLHVSNISNSLSEYSLNARNFDILPFESFELEVNFSPSSAGMYYDTLKIASDDADESLFEVPVSGKGIQTDNYPGTTLQFDGDDDYVRVPHSLIGNPDGSFSIETWVKMDNLPDYQTGYIIDKSKHTIGAEFIGYYIGYHFSNGIMAVMGDGSQWKSVTGETWNIGDWHHIVLVYNSEIQLLELYDNGISHGSTLIQNPVFTNVNLGIGDRLHYEFNGPFSGKIDNVSYWSIALDSCQVREQMHINLTGEETGLVSYWQFNEGSGNLLEDLVGNNDGTLNNMENNDWIESTIPFGGGFASTQIEADGTVDFAEEGLSIYFTSQNGAEITVSRIDTTANLNPIGPDQILDNQYWVVHRYGDGVIYTDLTFTLCEGLTTGDENYPSNISLYTRGSTADTSWALLTSASSVNATNNTATFEGITGFSQFIIAREVDLGIELNLSAFLEGPFNGNEMDANLYGLIPLEQPYNTSPWNYTGTETLTEIPTDMVDWVLIELRDASDSSSATPATQIAMQAALLMSDGSIKTLDGTGNPLFESLTVNQNLYAIIWHRNHLPVMSANAATENVGIYTYNFTTDAEQAYGNNQADLGNGYYGLFAADMNADGIINNDDLLLWKQQAGKTGYLIEDANLDGEVENKDKNDLWYQNQNKGQVLPE